MPAKRKNRKSSSGGPTNSAAASKRSKQEVRTYANLTTAVEEKKAQAGRYQLGPNECVPRLLSLEGEILARFPPGSQTITIQDMVMAVQEASSNKLCLKRLVCEDEEESFNEANDKRKEEIKQRELDIQALDKEKQEILANMENDIEMADELATQLGPLSINITLITLITLMNPNEP